MRTDIQIRTTGHVTCEKVASNRYPSKRHVERGDFIEWNDEGVKRGRIIGFTSVDGGNLPFKEVEYIVCVLISLGGCLSERWVLPSSVTASWDGSHNLYAEKMRWVYSADFMNTDPNVARDVFNQGLKHSNLPN